MPLDPQLAQLLAGIQGAPQMSEGTPEQARESFRRLNAYVTSVAPQIELAGVEQIEVDGDDGPLPARVYRPQVDGPVPTLVFFHGGGFVIGDVETHDLQCRLLCGDAGLVVCSVEYRLAPEGAFPAAVDDAVAATRWAAANVADLGGDPARLAVGGDSAGGNLAAVVSQELRGAEPPLAAQLLLYPVTDMVTDRPSRAANAEGYFLTSDDMRWFGTHYPASGKLIADPRVSPALSDSLAPAIVATAEFDPLLDDGDAYAQALQHAGVRVLHRRFDGLIHGFFAMGPLSEACAQAARLLCADLRELLA